MHVQVTALILNWNGKDYVTQCVQSVLEQTYPHIRVLVVDNASDDGSDKLLESHFPEINLIRNDTNLGFGGGNNVGISNCTSPYILMVNNDTTLEKDCVENLMAQIDADVSIGACATKILLTNAANRIDAAGIAVCPDGMSIGRGRMEHAEAYDETCEVFFASDCCCLYRKAMLDQIGLYDADFFAYDEETDLGWRAQRYGWRTLYVPGAVVYHHHSASSGSHSPFKAYLVERNRVWLVIKNFPAWLILYGVFYSLARYFWQAYGAFFRKGRAGDFVGTYSKTELIRILLRSYRDAIKGTPRALRQRREIMKKKKFPATKLWSLVRGYGVSAKSLALKE